MPTSPLTLVGAVVGTKAAVPSAVPSATLRFLLNGLRSLALSTALNNTEAGSGSGSGGTGSGSGSGDGSGSGSGSACGGDGSGGVDAGAGLKNLFLAELAGALPLSDADVHLVLTWLTDIHMTTPMPTTTPLLGLLMRSAHDDAARGGGAVAPSWALSALTVRG